MLRFAKVALSFWFLCKSISMARSPATVPRISAQLLELLPEDGSPVLNRVLRTMIARSLEAPISQELYFKAVDKIASEGLIGRARGQGGKIFLARFEPQIPLIQPVTDVWTEAQLMEPLKQYLNGPFSKAQDLPSDATWIVADTSTIGPRSGQWVRPDFIAVSVMRFQLLPGREVAVHSFELKTEAGGTVQAVHEALAQTRFTHFGHLVWHLPVSSKAEARLTEIKQQCEIHGIGLIIIRAPEDLESWEVILDPSRKETDTATIDGFLLTRLSEPQKKQLRQAVFGD